MVVKYWKYFVLGLCLVLAIRACSSFNVTSKDEYLAWTFNSEPVKLSNLPTRKDTNNKLKPIDINPTLKFTSNVELNLDSITKKIKLLPDGNTESLPFTVSLEILETADKEQSSIEELDPSSREWNYLITP